MTEVIRDAEQIGGLVRVLRQLSTARNGPASKWASMRLDRLAAGEPLTREDLTLAERLEDEVLTQRTLSIGARPQRTMAAEEDERSLATARATARRAPSAYVGK